MSTDASSGNARREAGDLETIDVSLYMRLAGDDLNLWRELVGHTMTHRDERYGAGTIIDARWGTFCEHVPEYVQVRVEYAGGLAATFRALALDETHRTVDVSREAADLLKICFGPDSVLDEDACEDAIAHHAERVRLRLESARAARIAARRRTKIVDD